MTYNNCYLNQLYSDLLFNELERGCITQIKIMYIPKPQSTLHGQCEQPFR